jgi:alpha/beta hydrolase fold
MERFEYATNTVDLQLDYHVAGRGNRSSCARPFVSWYAPLADALPGWSILRYERTVRAGGPDFEIEDDAAAVTALLRHVGFDRAHVVGHSYGGLVALALAGRPVRCPLARPHRTGRNGFLPRREAETAMAPILATYRVEGAEAGMDQFLRLVGGNGYRPVLDQAAPGAFDDAVAHAVQ